MFNCTTTTTTIRRLCFLALLCICLGAENATTTTTRCMEREKQALLKLKKGFNIDESSMLSSWAEEDDCCKWKEISCDNTTGHVTTLNLRHPDETTMYLAGTIHPSVCELQHLTYLDLSGNSIGGKIPDCFGSLSQLRDLKLGFNDLNGSIPYGLQNLSHLQTLDIGYNGNLVAKDLEWVSHLSSLKYLNLSFVDLSQAAYWQSSLSKVIPGLIELNLRGCSLNGSIPYGLQNLSHLQTLDVGRNSNLAVKDLEWVSHLSSLKYLDLSSVNLSQAVYWQSSLSKVIPGLIELNLRNCSLPQFHHNSVFKMNTSSSLKVLDLSSNGLNNSILSWVFNVSKLLTHLDLSYNFLEGSILDDFANMGSLEHLDLPGNKIAGGIPKSFQHMCNLQELIMYYSNLGGSLSDNIRHLCPDKIIFLFLSDIPFSSGPFPDFTNFTSVESLLLDNTSLSGEFPQFFGHFPNLSRLTLSNNNLSGSLPEFIGFPSLRELDLSNNQLSGISPSALTQLSSLIELKLFSNNISGVISDAFLSNLPNLTLLDVSHNLLQFKFSPKWIPPFQASILFLSSCTLGPHFPMWLKNQKRLRNLDISNAGISDLIPQWFWDQSSSIVYLNVSHNHIIGSLPKAFSNIKLDDDPLSVWNDYHYILDLSFNNLSGPMSLLPQNSRIVILSDNNLSGSLSSLCKRSQTYLSYLDLSNNLLSGSLPNCWELLQRLEILDLAHNNFSGRIPNSIGSLENIFTIHLSDNKLTGEIPFLKYCQELQFIDFGGNNLHGDFPTWIGEKLPNLVVLRLRDNKLQGSIHPGLCSLVNLQVLDLAQNNIAGKIPNCLNNISILSELRLLKNVFSYHQQFGFILGNEEVSPFFVDNAVLKWKGQDYEYGKNLGLMTSIDLSHNLLTGEIPHSITSLASLASLNLAGNNFTGFIPDDFGHMKMLESLDLSQNSISGTIPKSFQNLSFLAYMNISFNNLSGRIPSSTQLQSFDASAYVGNSGLCGPPLERECQEYNDPQEKKLGGDDADESINFGIYISVVLGFIVGFWGIYGSLILSTSWRHKYFQMIENMNDWILALVAAVRIKTRMQS